MTVVWAVLAGGVAALVRAEVAGRLGTRRGTAIVNLLGAFLLGLLVGLAGGDDADAAWLVVAGTGGMGGLTTFSTWMVDTTDRREDVRIPAVVVTLVVGALLAGAGWLVGGWFA